MRTRAGLLLRRLVVGVLARGVVRVVHDLVDALDGLQYRGLDTLLQRDVREAAALAAAAELDVGGRPLHAEEGDPAAVGRYLGVDVGIEEDLDLVLALVEPEGVGIGVLEAANGGALELIVDGNSVQVLRVAGLEVGAQGAGLDDEVVGVDGGLFDEAEDVLELAMGAAQDLETQASDGLWVRPNDLAQLGD